MAGSNGSQRHPPHSEPEGAPRGRGQTAAKKTHPHSKPDGAPPGRGPTAVKNPPHTLTGFAAHGCGGVGGLISYLKR